MPKELKPIPPPLSDDELYAQVIDEYIAELQEAKKVSIKYRVWGVIVPKARPRGTKTGHTYMPEHYVQSKETLIRSFQDIKQLYPQYVYPLEQASAIFIFDGKYDRRGDGDNIAGTLNDALVQGGILRGDNLLKEPRQSALLNYSDKRPPSILVVLHRIERLIQ